MKAKTFIVTLAQGYPPGSIQRGFYAELAKAVNENAVLSDNQMDSVTLMTNGSLKYTPVDHLDHVALPIIATYINSCK